LVDGGSARPSECGDVANRFDQARKAHPAPRAVGDVALRYEPSMLIGETQRPLRSWRPSAVWVAAVAAGLSAIALLLTNAPLGGAAAVVALAAALLWVAVWLERLDRRRRAFIVNFGTTSLRLDFVTPFAGRPRTLVVPFDAVRAVDVFEQDGGQHCLTVDFVPHAGATTVLREVLAAYVPPEQQEELRRLERVLRGAFGLGEPEEAPPEEEAPGPSTAGELT
jgi:hypothetical protein